MQTCRTRPGTSQVRDLFRRTGVQLDRTERLANALGHLPGVLQQLSALEGSQVKVKDSYNTCVDILWRVGYSMHLRLSI